jgi:hypothetical protein
MTILFHFKLKDKEEDMSEIDTMTDEDAERLYDAFHRLAWSANILDIEDLVEVFRSELKQESEPTNKEYEKKC